MSRQAPSIDQVDVDTYTVPTPQPEADGTFQWDATTAVVVHIRAGQASGLGWTYSSPAAAAVVAEQLSKVVTGRSPDDISGTWEAMRRSCRNFGTRGLIMQAISAVDVALWDLKARLRDESLSALLGQTRDTVPIYGSGGFTTLSEAELGEQVAAWRADGCTAMKIKIAQDWGRHIDRDLARVRQLRDLAGDDVTLMVDANGGYTVGQARRVGAALDELGVAWFEEPVSSDDLKGLGVLRLSLKCDVAAGEYVSDLYEARHLAPAVDCLQLDATRCGGFTGWLAGAAIASSHNLQVSAHCAPALHAPLGAAISNLRHIEYFVDHVRLEQLLFDGVPHAANGALTPNTDGPGHGLTLAAGAGEYRKSRAA
ncbi:mandelate racemase [Mycobacterium intermedium]|uniref:Mandelate racemase n=1 Tax=Mycobacterium intermedium TaxID=28445 RepID=A0A1E3S9D9_MYCIE|nr:enolase C-terminal domain-like protein [Mycobacterium intermedium]MCV6965419.1 mandelate racemase [Mycobacterium intermedium]ODQ98187.1 mandelate racemase [Mycobacterium intermedium]OPE47789.1 mandelate racemase [Mycobacterium intermedium]ORA97372.1 mandelate racemase [Mycobacterium intermedium]